MEKEDRNRDIFMKEIKDIYDEIKKGSTGIFKTRAGDIHYLLNGKFHRVDGPAVEYINGSKHWFFYGQRHRDDGPAEEWQDGSKFWFFYGQRHRSDGPAIEWPDGTKYWYFFGEGTYSEKEFYGPEWRKRIEIKRFL